MTAHTAHSRPTICCPWLLITDQFDLPSHYVWWSTGEKLWSCRSTNAQICPNISGVCVLQRLWVLIRRSAAVTGRMHLSRRWPALIDRCFITAEECFREVLWQTAAHFSSPIMIHVAEVAWTSHRTKTSEWVLEEDVRNYTFTVSGENVSGLLYVCAELAGQRQTAARP